MEYLKVKNWEEYQHYRDRYPPWIKLHAKLLNDFDFMSLAPASKCLLMLLWILASENEGKIKNDLTEIKFRLRDNKIKQADINLLIDKGFLNRCKQTLADASNVLASACLETETETETEKKRRVSKDTLVELKFNLGCFWCVWWTYLEQMNRNSTYKLTEKRRNKIKARLKDSTPTEIFNAIVACRDSPYHQGKNDSGKRYQDLSEHVLKSRDKVEWWNDKPRAKKPRYAT
jgi:hypothetical protein